MSSNVQVGAIKQVIIWKIYRKYFILFYFTIGSSNIMKNPNIPTIATIPQNNIR